MATSLQSIVFLLTCGLVFNMLVPSTADFMTDEFKKWMKDYGVKYDSLEQVKRFAIFKANYMFVNESNLNPALGYTLGLNEFAAMTTEEFMAKHTGYSSVNSVQTSTSFSYGAVTAPASVDWRDLGAVTDVKNQGSCGSCWAFGAVATIEGITKIKKGYLPVLSEQELVECVTECYGCAGGWQQYAFVWVIQNGGISYEQNYTYTALNGTCDATKTNNYAANITGYQQVPERNETALMNAVFMQPVTVSIEAGGLYFQFYESGIFTGPCGTQLDHAVTVVGYGTEGSSNYWIVKNSWGPTWGENGYIRMLKDNGYSAGLCGIALDCSYPIA